MKAKRGSLLDRIRLAAIKQIAIDNGGIPSFQVAIENESGDVVAWAPTGEVRTVRGEAQ